MESSVSDSDLGTWQSVPYALGVLHRRQSQSVLEYSLIPGKEIILKMGTIAALASVFALFMGHSAPIGRFAMITAAIVMILLTALNVGAKKTVTIDLAAKDIKLDRWILGIHTRRQLAFCDLETVSIAYVDSGPILKKYQYRVVVNSKKDMSPKSLVIAVIYQEQSALVEAKRVAAFCGIELQSQPRRGIS